jgi:hypothetical protein
VPRRAPRSQDGFIIQDVFVGCRECQRRSVEVVSTSGIISEERFVDRRHSIDIAEVECIQNTLDTASRLGFRITNLVFEMYSFPPTAE